MEKTARIKYTIKNKNTNDYRFETYLVCDIEKGLGKLIDLEDYDIISREIVIIKEDNRCITENRIVL